MPSFVPSLAGLSLKPAERQAPRPAVPIRGLGDEADHDEYLYQRYMEDLEMRELQERAEEAGYRSAEEYERALAAQAAAQAAPAPARGSTSNWPAMPLATPAEEAARARARAAAAAGPSDWLGQVSEEKRAELKRKAEDALAATEAAKRARAEAKAAEKAAAKEAKDLEKAAERAAAAEAKAEAKAEAARLKEAEKAEAARLKEAEKAEAARLKQAEKEEAARLKEAEKGEATRLKEAEKAEAARLKEEATRLKEAEKEETARLKEAEKAEAARLKAEEDAMDQAEADAEGISVKTLKARRTKVLKAAKEAGYESVAEYQEALAAEAAEAQARAEEAAAAQAAAQAAAKAAEEAEARRLEKEEACAELEEQIHRLRWQQRSMAEDYAQMLKEWEENDCGEPKPAWMDELNAIFQKLSDAIQGAEDSNPVAWEVSEGGKHAEYAEKFADEAENEEQEGEGEGEGEEEDELPGGYTVKDEASSALAQGKAKGSRKDDLDVDMDVEDDTLQIDLRVIVQNVRDDSEEKEKWRTQVIHTDHDNLPMSGAKYISVPDPDSQLPGATKLVRTDKEKEPYPSDIPQAYIDDLHAEVIGIERAVRGLTISILGEAATPQSLLDSVAASPMTAYDSTNTVTQQNLGFIKGKGMLLTQYAVTMELPSNDEANRAKAGTLIEGLVTLATEQWSDVTGLRVKTVSGVQDKDSYMMGMLRMQKAKRDDPPNAKEKQFLAEKFGPDWYKAEGGVRPDDLMDALEWFRKMMKDMDQQERIDKMVAEQRKVGAEHAEAVRQADGQDGGGGGGGRRKPSKGAVQRKGP